MVAVAGAERNPGFARSAIRKRGRNRGRVRRTARCGILRVAGPYPGITENIQKLLEYSRFRAVSPGMKRSSLISKLLHGSALSVLVVAIGAGVGCMTTYDSAGRPVQSVDPAVAVAGAAAAGLVGYAIANDNDHHHGYYRPRPYYYGGGGYYRRR